MRNIAIVGMQWGDEGKGKMTDYLAQNTDVVVRYQGGDNAGHTVVFDGKKIDLHLLPSGIIHKNVINIMAHGMVINLETLFKEIRKFKSENLYISDRAHLILPFHKDIDTENDRIQKIGTTKKGIGPTYSDKILRRGVRMSSLQSMDRFIHDVRNLCSSKKISFDPEKYYKENFKNIKEIIPKITNTSFLLNKFVEENKRIIFEGAQGVMLDIDHGTYPYVTSSSPSVSGLPQAVGIAPWKINAALGIIKAYSTRVGEGPFPTEMGERLASKIREAANEYGTTTGRPRRIGYLDLVALKHASLSSGLTYIAFTICDVLNNVDVLKICDYYTIDGKKINSYPSHIEDLKLVKPHYIEFPSFQKDITNVKKFDELPVELKNYLLYISKELKSEIAFVSVGPDRKQTIICNEIWEKRRWLKDINQIKWMNYGH